MLQAFREPLVGRDTALRVLRQCVEDTARGQGRGVLIVGEPGLGKTRLANEVVVYAARAGLSLWRASVPEDRSPLPLGPWLPVLRAALAAARPESAQRFLTHAPADLLRQVRGNHGNDLELGRGPNATPEARFEVFDAVSELLGTLAEQAPRLLLIENLDRADLVSVELLASVTESIQKCPLLVVATRRPIRSFPKGSGDVWRSLDRSVRRLELEVLERKDIEQYVEALEGRVQVKPSLLARISGGNPLLVSEVVRLLMLGVAPDDLAPDAAGLLRQHVDRLDDSARRALSAAAVLGTEFDLAGLSQILNEPQEELLASLDEALRCDLLRPLADRSGGYAFAHADLQSAVLSTLEAQELTRLHAAAAAHLESTSAKAEVAFDLAHHCIAAGRAPAPERLVGATRRAGDIATGLLGFERAASLYESAIGGLSGISSANPFDRFVLHMSKAYAHRLAGNLEPAIDAYLEAARIARRHDMPGNLARAALGLRGCIPLWSRGDGLFFLSRLPLDDDPIFGRLHREAPALLEEAAADLPKGDRTLNARVLAHIADSSPLERRRSLSYQALKLAARTEDATTQFDVLSSRLHALWHPDDVDEIIQVTDSLIRLAERTAQAAWAWEARWRRRLLCLSVGDRDHADRQRRGLEEIAERTRHPVLNAALDIIRISEALMEGRFEDADDLLEDASNDSEQHSAHFTMVRMFQSGELWRARGKPDAFVKTYDRILRDYAHLGSIVTVLVAHAYLEAGQTGQARALYRSVVKIGLSKIPKDANYLPTLAHLATLAVALGDKNRYAPLYDLLRPYAARNAVSVIGMSLGSASRYLGMLAAARGDRIDAERRYRDSLRMNERMNAKVQLAFAQLELARLLAEGDEASRARARTEIARARKTAHALAMPRLSERLEKLAAAQ